MSNSLWDLETDMVIPSDCPVSLGNFGEMKYAGAYVIDPDDYMEYGQALVFNASGAPVAQNVVEYQYDIYDGWSAIIETAYPAATAYQGYGRPPGSTYTSDASDDGIFQSGPTFGDWVAHAEVYINYKQASANASISGPDVPLRNTSSTWSASASGGVAPYTYAWYRNGQVVGNGASYSAGTGTAEFGLRLEVTDQTASTTKKDFWVDVDGVRATIAGPSLVYSSQNGGTWTASGRGGYEPYTFDWYFVDGNGNQIALGTGATYSGYPGQGSGTLSVTMTDAHGRAYQQAMQVQGIGDP